MANELQPHYRAKEAAKLLGIGKSTFWRWVQCGKVSRGTQLSARCTVWAKEDLEAVLASHKKG